MNERTFWSHVNKTEGCWHWTSTKDIHGYGKWDDNGRTRGTHRIAYELVKGDIPKGAVLDHLCHDPKECTQGGACKHRACVNPDHMALTTSKKNTSKERAISWQAKKTHCARGHEFTEENTYLPTRGGRMCRTCKRASDKRAVKRRQEAYKLMKELGLA